MTRQVQQVHLPPGCYSFYRTAHSVRYISLFSWPLPLAVLVEETMHQRSSQAGWYKKGGILDTQRVLGLFIHTFLIFYLSFGQLVSFVFYLATGSTILLNLIHSRATLSLKKH